MYLLMIQTTSFSTAQSFGCTTSRSYRVPRALVVVRAGAVNLLACIITLHLFRKARAFMEFKMHSHPSPDNVFFFISLWCCCVVVPAALYFAVQIG